MFDKIYYETAQDQLIDIFCRGGRILKRVNMTWLIENYMKSEHRESVEKGNPRAINQIGDSVVHELFDGVNYPKDGDHFEDYEYEYYWIATIYSYVSFKYNYPCKTLIGKLPVELMLKLFKTGHERGINNFSELIYETYLK